MSIKKANEPESAPHGTLRVMQCLKVEKKSMLARCALHSASPSISLLALWRSKKMYTPSPTFFLSHSLCRIKNDPSHTGFTNRNHARDHL